MATKKTKKFKMPPATLNAGPAQVGNTVVKTPKAKKLPDATSKPSLFYKAEGSNPKQPSIQKLKDFLGNRKSKSGTSDNLSSVKEVQMSEIKKSYTAEETARAVLTKAQEMLAQKLAKSEEPAADSKPGSYGNVTPHTDHVGMASMPHNQHYDLKGKHRQNAAIATAKGDKGLAEKHSKMADMHHAYQSGIIADHAHINIAGKMHSELSSKKESLAKAEQLHAELAKSSDMDHGSKKGPEGYSKYQEQAQNQKGVHTPVSGVTGFPGGKGTSEAGDMSTQTYGGKPHRELRDHGKEMHRQKLSEMKAMPKPNLTKDEDDGSVTSSSGKGIHKLSKFVGRLEGKKGSNPQELEKAVGDKTKDGLVTLKEPKKEEMVRTHLVGDKTPGMHPKSSVGSAIPKEKK